MYHHKQEYIEQNTKLKLLLSHSTHPADNNEVGAASVAGVMTPSDHPLGHYRAVTPAVRIALLTIRWSDVMRIGTLAEDLVLRHGVVGDYPLQDGLPLDSVERAWFDDDGDNGFVASCAWMRVPNIAIFQCPLFCALMSLIEIQPQVESNCNYFG